MLLTAVPETSTTVWIVALPDMRPFALQRSIDGGGDWQFVSSISEAWTAATYNDVVSTTSFPMYRAVEE